MFEKDEHKGESNQVEEVDSLKKQSDFMDKITRNINDISESINRDDNKKRRKDCNSEKKGSIKKSKSEFDTDEKKSDNVQKKQNNGKGVSEVREVSIETYTAEKEETKQESSKSMCLGNNVEAKRLSKYELKKKNEGWREAVATAPETLQHSEMQEAVDVQKSCTAEDINEMVHEKGEYLRGEKKKQKREKVSGNNSGHIAVITTINDGNEADQNEGRIHGNSIEEVECYNTERKRKRKSANFCLGDEKPKNISNGTEQYEFNHSNSELNDNATESKKQGVNNDEDGNRDEKRETCKSMKSDSDGKKHKFADGNDREAIYSKNDEASASIVLKMAGESQGEDVSHAKNGKEGRKQMKGKSRISDSEGRNDKEDARTRKNVNSTYQSENATKERSKKVSFSDHVEVFPGGDDIDAKKNEKGGLVHGKRFSKEEDRIVMDAVANYIELHELGDEGISMVLNCKDYPETRSCWKEIGAAIPWRPTESVYHRAHILFERDEKHRWTLEELEYVRKFVEKHGTNWRLLGDSLGKHRHQVKDTWRRIKLTNQNKGKWSQEEYQNLFDLVNMDLSMKAFEEKKSKHGLLRDNVSWTAISEKIQTRSSSNCCNKWYKRLASPMVAEGIWADVDDYRLVDGLSSLDACCMEDVDWDNLIEHRSGDVCRKRWNQMVQHIDARGNSSFAEQVEILAKRYRPDMLDAREAYDNKHPVDLP